jgi:hypothetical protein
MAREGKKNVKSISSPLLNIHLVVMMMSMLLVVALLMIIFKKKKIILNLNSS